MPSLADNRTTILVTCSTTFKEALGKYAQQHNVSLSSVIKDATAQLIGYEFGEDDDRPRKYASPEERKQAYKDKAKKDRDEAKKILQIIMREQRLNDAAALEEWLNKRMEQANA